MKRKLQRLLAAMLAWAVLLMLTGCTTWRDEDGTHFMLFGERGPSGEVSRAAFDSGVNRVRLSDKPMVFETTCNCAQGID